MAKQEPAARKQSRSKRGADQRSGAGRGRNGHEQELARYEEELEGYLQERIKPGLNRGAIPLLARSIAKELAHREHPPVPSPDVEARDEPSAEADDEHSAEADDEPSAEADDEQGAEDGAPDFEADMRELQSELGEDWILSFSVQGDDGWLTAEKDDGSQRVEAQTASVILEAVELLKEDGGRGD